MSKRIAVIMGGASFERNISIKSGKMIVDALEEAGYSALPLDANEELVPTLQAKKPEACYLALHGKGAEDGSVAAILEFLDLPYIGSRPEVARLTNYKPSLPFVMAQNTLGAAWPEQFSLPESAFRTMDAAYALPSVSKRLHGYPLAVKPARGGSALGLTKVTREAQLGDAVMEALAYDDEVLFQQWIEGHEVSCVVMPGANRAFSPIEITTKNNQVYDTEARLVEGIAKFVEPHASIDRDRVREIALGCAKTYDASGLVRVDMVCVDDTVYLLDLKVSPGLGKNSLALSALEHDCTTLSEVVDKLVKECL